MDKQEQSPNPIEASTWHGWDSPVGLAIGLLGLAVSAGVVLTSVALMLWLLHVATIIG